MTSESTTDQYGPPPARVDAGTPTPDAAAALKTYLDEHPAAGMGSGIRADVYDALTELVRLRAQRQAALDVIEQLVAKDRLSRTGADWLRAALGAAE